MLPGCKKPLYQRAVDFNWLQQEAKLFDIPILLGASPLMSESNASDGNECLVYISSRERSVIVDYYQQEMERHGWQQQPSFYCDETVLNFKKPGRFTTILIRSAEGDKKLFKILIFVRSVEI